MADRQLAPQTRLSALLLLVRNGVLTGLLVAGGGVSASFLVGGQGWEGVLRGINGASLALAVWAGLIVLGHAQGRELRAARQQELLYGDPLPLEGSVYPWGAILTAVFGSASCALACWVLRALLIRYSLGL